jgi:hypothetical protein
MASGWYAGWIGQIYSEGKYGKRITRRSHRVGDKTFNEETLPVESVTEYFEHFPLLEIDYTFYRLLLEAHGNLLRISMSLKAIAGKWKKWDGVSYEESYAKAFPFDKIMKGMLDPEMIEDSIKIVNEVIKDKVRVNLIINNRAGGNAPLIAQKIADRLHKERQQRLFWVRSFPIKVKPCLKFMWVVLPVMIGWKILSGGVNFNQ